MEQENKQNTDNDTQKAESKITYADVKNFVIQFLGALASGIFLLLLPFIIKLLFLPQDVQNLQEDFGKLEERVATLESNTTTETPSSPFINLNINFSNLLPTRNTIIEGKKRSVEVSYLLSAPTWKDSDTIAIDKSTGESYTASQLANQKILLPYEEGNNTYYFYGQFDENNQWDGTCITNNYENGNLVLIMEAEYLHGKLLSYKQVLRFQDKLGDWVWSISERQPIDNYNCGDTWTYFLEHEFPMNFNSDSVVESDIMSIDDFISIIDSPLEGFYHGNTSNGLYNDSTGNAYMVKYSDDETIRTLYIGNFKNGDFEDNTGTALEIVFDDYVNKYFYYVGNFSNGNRISDENLEYLTLNEIEQMLDGMTFNCELNWKDVQEQNN